MSKIRFKNGKREYQVTLTRVNDNCIQMIYENEISESTLTSGFSVINEYNGTIMGKYLDYNTIYRIYEDNDRKIELSNDESVYVPPVEEPEPEYPTPEPPPEPTIDDIKTMKMLDLSNTCSTLIENGVDILIDDSIEHFSYKQSEDQSNIKELFDTVLISGEGMYYHCDNGNCKLYTRNQIISIYVSAATNKTHHTTYFNQLRSFVNSLDNKDSVLNITYGVPLEGEYLETYCAAMEQSKNSIIAVLTKHGLTEEEITNLLSTNQLTYSQFKR